MKFKRSILVPLLVGLAALVTGGWFLQQGTSERRSVYMQAQLLDQVIEHVSERFVEKKKPSELYRMAIEGLLEQLGDPHTVFMTPEEYKNLQIQTQGEYGGLGIRIGMRNDWITVIAPLPGTPAAEAGLKAGDRIIAVEGESTKGWTIDDAVAALRGPKGAPVHIKVARIGYEEPIPFRIVRDEIHIQAVRVDYIMDGNIGYVQLAAFRERATEELRRAINRLRERGIQGLILDLRGNPGGLLDESISVADLFLKSGVVVAETRSRIERQSHTFRTDDPSHYEGLPVVVLVGPHSASAAEILAGALQDHDRALIVGQTTFGKGSVQTLFPLAGGNYLKLTTARWYTPSGRSIQKPYGIGADDESAQDTTPKIFRTDAGRKVRGGGGIHPDVVVKPDTASRAAQEFMEAVIGEHGSAYYSTRWNFVVRFARGHDLERGFDVTPAMLDSFYRALRDSGIEVERDLYDAASEWIARDLAVEIAGTEWSEEAAQRRWNINDPQVRAALRLLKHATDAQSLFAAARQYRAERKPAEASATATPHSPAGR